MKIGDDGPRIIKAFGNDLPAIKDIETNSKKAAGGFGSTIGSAIQAIENEAKSADDATTEFLDGEIGLHEAMIRMEKANLMIKMGSTVRSKMLDAYQKLLSSAG